MIKNIKKLYKKFRIDGYIVPKNDEYFNEFVSKSKDRLRFISNFSGSSGFAIISKNKNYLFVDGRYSIQAKYESGKKFRIITIPKHFPKDVIKTKKKITFGFDPNLFSRKQLKFLFKIKNVKLKPVVINLIDKVWKNKPKDRIKPFYSISSKNSGLSVQKKIKLIKRTILKEKADYLLITAPENVAWALNLRGYDSLYSPIPNSRLLLNKNGEAHLFLNPKKYKNIMNKRFIIKDEKKLEKNLSCIKNKKIWLDSMSCSVFFEDILAKKNNILFKSDPIYFLKSVKNKVEIKNMQKSHLVDGIALTRFLFWIKKNYKRNNITELSAQKKLEKFRKLHPSYKFPSFNTISGSGPNSAIIHYNASKKTNRVLRKGELYLVDSGGQYSFGTTDVTRTISLDNNSNYIRNIYTRVLKGHIAVSNFIIKKNTTGSEIDREARKFLKKINLDYPHGTGHGVGYFLNVHEGPQSFSKNNKFNLKDGMIISNEPGYYKEGSFGIRIENLIYIKKNKFKELTIAPIEKELINKNILDRSEIKWINNYHYKVKKNLIKFMRPSEKKDLIKACSPI